MARRSSITWIIAALALLTLTGCKGDLDQIVGEFNARATQIAGGDYQPPTTAPGETPVATAGPGQPTPSPPPPTATPLPETFRDLTSNPNARLVQAWGQTYGQGSGTSFTIRADQFQVGEYIVQWLQTSGYSDTVRGGQAVIAVGQMRLDLALQDDTGRFGSGVATFQPTIAADGSLRLNPQGANFGGVAVPANFTASLGDSVHAALTGAPTDQLSRVTLTQLSLDDGILTVAGTVK